jgi:hypothetical protein
MKVPKKFRLNEATETYITLAEGALWATDGTIAARVPVGEQGLELDEGDQERTRVTKEGWAQATRGKLGEGQLDLSDPARVTASSGPGKAILTVDVPPGDPKPPGSLPARLSAPENAVRIAVDAEALARLQRALGATEGVMVHVGEDGAYYVEPVSTDERGPSGLISRIRWTD